MRLGTAGRLQGLHGLLGLPADLAQWSGVREPGLVSRSPGVWCCCRGHWEGGCGRAELSQFLTVRFMSPVDVRTSCAPGMGLACSEVK